MAKNSKKAKFFCENCGSEVPENSKVCKNCGKFFSAVRCPNCGVTGHSSDFKNGCPECGYAVNKKSKNITYSTAGNSKTAANAKALAAIFGGLKSRNSKAYSVKNENSLPLWIYIFTATLMFVLLFAVYSCIRG